MGTPALKAELVPDGFARFLQHDAVSAWRPYPIPPPFVLTHTIAVPSRRALLASLGVLGLLACRPPASASVTAEQRTAIADTLRGMLVRAYDLAQHGDPVARLMSLYPRSGSVVSASGGQVTTSRDTLEAGIRAFWDNVGRNMRNPRWMWGDMHVDVLGPDAAVVTTTYRVPHLTPRGEPHVIAGAWTAVFQRREGRWAIIQEHLSDAPAPMLMR